MGRMGRKERQKDSIGVAKVDKIGCYMAAVAVKQQKTPSTARFLFSIAIEHLGEPGKPKIVVRPSRRRMGDENLVLLRHIVVNPARLNAG